MSAEHERSIPEKAKDICIELERLAADRAQLIETCRSLNQLDYRLRSRMEVLEQDLMDALNIDDSESLDIQDIGHLRIILQRADQYNVKPYFEVRYPSYYGVYTTRHFLRKPGNKRKPKKGT